jgi:hypothetical protein
MRVAEAAKQLGISPASVRKRITDGSLAATKVPDPKAWPDGWRWEVTEARVKANEGRWKGRGKYREQWLTDNYQVEHIVIDANEGRMPPMSTTTSPQDQAKESSGQQILRYVAIAALLVSSAQKLVQEWHAAQHRDRDPKGG